MAAAPRTKVRRVRRRLVRGTTRLLGEREETWSFDTAESETFSQVGQLENLLQTMTKLVHVLM